MFTEAASLLAGEFDVERGGVWSLPSVVIVTINVQHLLAFNTQHAIPILAF
jgi:hypothetical protein